MLAAMNTATRFLVPRDDSRAVALYCGSTCLILESEIRRSGTWPLDTLTPQLFRSRLNNHFNRHSKADRRG